MPEKVAPLQRPKGLSPNGKVINRPTQEFIVAGHGYSSASGVKVLNPTQDEVEIEVNLRTYEIMENDSTITKTKKILITNALSDEMQLAPRRTEAQVGEAEHKIYIMVMEFCQRIIEGLDRPYRESAEQLLGNGIRHGHGIAEIEWEYRLDEDKERPTPADISVDVGQTKSVGFFGRVKEYFTAAETPAQESPKVSLNSKQTRLLPKGLKVKPRGAARFVVDDYMNVLGISPRITPGQKMTYNDIIDRTKFMVLTLNKMDEDPRGKSSYRAAYNWHNLKTQLPSELLRFIFEESVPKAVAILPENAPGYEMARDEQGAVIFEEDGVTPVMMTAAESMKEAIENFRSGSGIVVPFGAIVKPYKTGLTGSTDAMLFQVIIKIIDDQIENAILLQTLAQSEGEHQARSASQQVAELLHNLVFWIKWLMAVMTQKDLFETAVVINYGEWARKYIPQVSFGDFVRRDWGQDLAVLADAYDKGFIDDQQRVELMSWLNMPPPGPSVREQDLANPNSQLNKPNNTNQDDPSGPPTEKKNESTKPKQ